MLGNIVGTACLVAVGCSAHALDSRSTINTTACADTHLIIARGSTESYPGTLGALADLIIGNITSGSADYENVIYPAVDETSSDSYFIGRAAFASQLKTYADACRDSKIVILSYSQGAMIVGDALAGGGGQPYLGNATAPLVSAELGQRITGIVHYGDPRHVANKPWDIGYNNVTGKYPRLPAQIKVLDRDYRDVIADYCNVEDPVCSQGTDFEAHLEYTEIWNDAATQWVLEKIGA